MIHSVLIIGGGCAGLSAAIYCARALLKPLVFSGNLENKGGLLVKTSIVENFPGYPDGINGFELISNMESQAIKYGAEIIDEEIIQVNFKSKPYTLTCSNGNTYQSHSVIICTGSSPNKLHLPNEDQFWSAGVSSCAVCDGALYKDKSIMVVGGGDSAMEEALFLTKFSNVTLIHRRDQFRASRIMQERVLNHPKINIHYNTIIEELNGDNKLKSVTLKNVISGKKTTVDVDGLFYGLGLTPNSKIFENELEMSDDGYIIRYRDPEKNYKTVTSVEGIFVAGDVTDKRYKQAIVACGDGCKSALDAIKYLENVIH